MIKESEPPSTQFCPQEALVLGMGLDVGIKKVGQKEEPKKKKCLNRESPLKDKSFTNFSLF